MVAGEDDVVELRPGSADGFRRDAREGDAVQWADVSAATDLHWTVLGGDAAGDGRTGLGKRAGESEAENGAGVGIDGKLSVVSGIMRVVGATAGKVDAKVRSVLEDNEGEMGLETGGAAFPVAPENAALGGVVDNEIEDGAEFAVTGELERPTTLVGRASTAVNAMRML
jgi:hypothetical protein